MLLTHTELCRGNAGIPLRDQDATTRKDGEWTKINTLGYYGIAEMVGNKNVCIQQQALLM